jgi:hypothetical protein
MKRLFVLIQAVVCGAETTIQNFKRCAQDCWNAGYDQTIYQIFLNALAFKRNQANYSQA